MKKPVTLHDLIKMIEDETIDDYPFGSFWRWIFNFLVAE